MREKFIVCGVLGWCMEIVYTGLRSTGSERRTLTGRTSVFMFPIYGAACLISPVSRKLKKLSAAARGLIYMTGIFCGEFISGSFLKKRKLCPWDYSGKRMNIGGVIRLDYAPLWFAVGLFYERILDRMNFIEKKVG